MTLQKQNTDLKSILVKLIADHKADIPKSSLARAFGINRTTLLKRLKNGWTMEMALMTPIVNPVDSGRLGGQRNARS